jgi:hypothetical protein
MKDISNLPLHCLKKNSSKVISIIKAFEEQCKIIESPPIYYFFNVGFNLDINKRALLDLQANVKVRIRCILYILFKFYKS